MLNFGLRHLQKGWMLNSDLIPNQSKEWNVKLFWKTKIKDCALYLDLCTGHISNCSAFEHRSGGGGTHKTTSGNYLYIWTVDWDAEIHKYHSETGANSQTAHLAIKCLMANYCIRWRGVFKGLSQDGRIFLKNCRASSFNKDLSNEPNFSRIHLAGQ